MMNYMSPQVDFSPVQTTNDEAWFVVLLAVLLAMGATFVLGAAAWCLATGNGTFTGGWSVKDWGVSLNIECK